MDYRVTASTVNESEPVSVRDPGIASNLRVQNDILAETYAILSALYETLFGERLDGEKAEEPKCMEQNVKMNTERCNVIRARLKDIYDELIR